MNRKRIYILLAYIVFLLNCAISVEAATITWNGGGSDNYASNPANWSFGVIPQAGDTVVFDNTSSKDCTWNLSVKLSSLIKNSGYTGKITKSAGVTLTIAKGFVWTGMGEDNLASNPANWSKNTVPETGYSVVFNGTSSKDCVWDISVSPSWLSLDATYAGTVSLNTALSLAGDLSVNGGFLDLNNKSLDVDGDLLIGPNGTLYGTSSVIKVKGDWINRGTFVPETSTVILNGMDQTVYGDNTFFNLTKITDVACTLSFEAGKTQTILNNLTLLGSAGNLLYLRSTVDGQHWYLDARGTRHISYTSIKDLNCINPIGIDAKYSEDSGNNVNLNFGGDQCACLIKKKILTEALRDYRRQLC